MTEISQRLESNTAELSPLTVKWSVTYRSPLPLDTLLKTIKYPERDTAFLSPKVFELSWDRGKLYYLATEQSMAVDERTMKPDPAAPLKTQQREIAVDLDKFYWGSGTKQYTETKVLPLLSIRTIDQLKQSGNRRLAYLRPDYFLSAGFEFPAKASDIGKPARPLLSALEEMGAEFVDIGRDRIDGTECTVIELKGAVSTLPQADGQILGKGPYDRIHRFYFDDEKGLSLVRREELTADRRRVVSVQNSDFVRLRNTDAWMPKHCTVEYFTWASAPEALSSDPLLIAEYDVQELLAKSLAPDRFRLSYSIPGTNVVDYTLPGAEKQEGGYVAYRVPVNLSDLDSVIRDAMSKDGAGHGNRILIDGETEENAF